MLTNSVLPFEIYYTNSRGDSIYFDRLPYIMTGGSLFDTRWKAGTVQHPLYDGCRLISSRRSADKLEMTLEISAENRLRLAGYMSGLSDLLDYDMVSGTAGRLYINGQYMRCWCTASEKKLSCDLDASASVKLTVLPESPVWFTEKHYSIPAAGTSASDGHKYPYKYPKRYGAGRRMVIAENSYFAPAPVRIVFYGEAEDPKLYLGSQCIGVNISVGAGEYAVIDQLTREVYSVSQSGERINRFNERDRGGGVFTYLPPGSNMLTLDSDGGADIILYERRSEPVWALN